MAFTRALFGTLAAAALLSAPCTALGEQASEQTVIAALPALETYIENAMDAGAVPGLSVAIVYKDEVVYLRGFGVREMGKPETVDGDTVFQLASVSKPLASTVVSMLVSQGVVSWDSRMAEIDPTFSLMEAFPSTQITLNDLFAHRSGLPGLAGDDLERLGYERDAILQSLRLVTPASSFRSTYSYSNYGITAAAQAAARAAGMTWEEASDTLLYEPLGMASTSSRHDDFLTESNRSALHIRYDDAWQALAAMDADAQSPAGGVSSSAADMAQWMRLQLAGGSYDGEMLIDPRTFAQSHEPVISRGFNPISGLPGFYGHGWVVSYGPQGIVWGHAGAFSQGTRTYVALLPGEDLGIVVLTNAFPSGLAEAVAETYFDLVFDGEASRDWLTPWDKHYSDMFVPAMVQRLALYGTPPASPGPALPAVAYTGTYGNAYAGAVTVQAVDGALTISLGPDGVKSYPLEHFDRDLFLYYPYTDLPDYPATASFEVGPEWVATGVVLDQVADSGFEDFTRLAD